MTEYTEILNNYKTINSSAEKNAVVFFGADWLSGIPVAELARDAGIDAPVYNRSLSGLTLGEAEQAADTCVCSLQPDKVFINIGENDICEGFDKKEFAEKYEWLLYTLHSKCCCKIYILSIVNDKFGAANGMLRAIAEKYGCEYVDIQDCRTSFRSFFSKVRFFLRKHPISFYEAMRS
ncbi:MAG: hypothetical protein IJ460_07510 [Clostridia bacterium]|nr:hypothetical protein [Clostridia bacterium]